MDTITSNSMDNGLHTPKRMMTVHREAGHTTVYINASSLSIIQSCMRKAEYALHRDLRSELGSPATTFGSAIHKALETFYTAPREQRILPPNFRKEMEMMVGGEIPHENSFLLYRATRDFIRMASPLSNLPADDKRSIESGVWSLSHYFETYIDDPYEVMQDSQGKYMTELTLQTILISRPELTIYIFGTIDVILKSLTNLQILVTDHKTSSMVGKDFYNRLKPNHQYTGYIYLVQQCLGLSTDKFMVNCIQVKPKPKTARGTRPDFPRQITTRSPEDITEFKACVEFYVEQYLKSMDSGVWPQGSPDSCSMYGGCQYLDICSSPHAIRQNIIDSRYNTTPKTHGDINAIT